MMEIGNLISGVVIEGVVLIKDVQLKMIWIGDFFLVLCFVDWIGEISGNFWDVIENQVV